MKHYQDALAKQMSGDLGCRNSPEDARIAASIKRRKLREPKKDVKTETLPEVEKVVDTISLEEFCVQVKEHPEAVTTTAQLRGNYRGVVPVCKFSMSFPANYKLMGAGLRTASQAKKFESWLAGYEESKK